MYLDIFSIKKYFFKRLKEKYYLYDRNLYENHKLSFSQEGEDIILARYFEGRKSGFYVDVGAHHPQRFSNTFSLYMNGWRGINIDATPGSMEMFNQLRPNDINLELAISENPEHLQYYLFEESALNTLDTKMANLYISKGWPLKSKIKVETVTLKDVLDKYAPSGKGIDLLNIDVEGYDYEVLMSNDWNKFRPKLILIESLDVQSLEDVCNCNVYRFLHKEDYKLVAKTYNTLFFKSN